MSFIQGFIIGSVGLVGGLLSGAFGIGGGLVIVPGLVILAGFGLREAAGTSLAALLLPVGVLGALEYWRAGEVNVAAAALIAVGLLVGAYLGARFSLGLPVELVGRAFGVLLLVVGVKFALFP